jgi:hypothetical protein
MELQLKNVYFSERLSEETNAFTADVWFKGKKVGYAKNDGHGGCTYIHSYDGMREEFKKAEAYAKTLPDIVTDFKGKDGKPFVITSDLESQVEEMFTNWLDVKEIKKNEKKGIFYQKPNGVRATTYWKGWTIPKLLERPDGRALIIYHLAELIAEGNTILNTNLDGILPPKR